MPDHDDKSKPDTNPAAGLPALREKMKAHDRFFLEHPVAQAHRLRYLGSRLAPVIDEDGFVAR